MPDYEAVIDGQKYKVSFPQEPTDADFKSAIVGFQKARGSTSALPPAPVSSTVGIIPSKFDLLAAKGVKLHDPLAQLFADRKAIAAANPAMPRQQVIDRANRIAHVRALAKEAGRGVVFGNDVTEGPGSTPIKRGVPSMSVGDVTGGGGNAQEVSPGDAALTYLGVPMNQEDYPNTFMGQAAHRLTQLPGGLTEPKSLAIGAGAALATAAFPPAGVPIALGFGAQQGYSGGQQLAQGRPGAAAVDATMGMLAALGAARHASGLKRTSAVEPAPISDVATLGDPESIIRSAERAAAKNGPGEVPAPRPLTKEEAAFAALSPKKQAAARVKMEKEAAALLARSKAQQSEVDRLMQSNLDPNTPAYTKTPPLDVATGTREGFNEVGRLPQDTESTLFRQRFGIQSQEAPPVEPAIGQSPANPPPVNTTPAPFARPPARPTLLDATQEVPNALQEPGTAKPDAPVSEGGEDSPVRRGRLRQGKSGTPTAGAGSPQEAPGEVPAATGETGKAESSAPAKGPQAANVAPPQSTGEVPPSVPGKATPAPKETVTEVPPVPRSVGTVNVKVLERIEKCPPSECFPGARKWAEANETPGTTVVHGKLTVNGVRFDHAWVEQGDVVIDPSAGVKLKKSEFYANMNPEVDARYTPEQSTILAAKTGHAGPYTQKEASGKFLEHNGAEPAKAEGSQSRPPAAVSNTDTPPAPSKVSKIDAAVADAVAQLGRGEKLNPSEIAAKHGLSHDGAQGVVEQAYDEAPQQTGVEKARAELKAKLNKLSSGLDPVLLLKLAKLGAEHLKAGVKTFGEFSKRMADEYGPVIKPYMKKLWADANTIHAGGTIKEKPIPAAIANMAAYRDQARNHFQQNQSYTQRVAPDTSKALTRLAAARDIVEAETARVQEVFDKRKMSPEMRQAYGALLAEDRNANLGTHTFDPASRLQTPGMQSLTRDYNAAEGAIFPKYRQSGGYGDTQSRGRTSKAFMPLLPAEFAESYGVSKGGRPTTRTIAELARMPGEKQFKGKLNSTNAITDPVEAIRVRLSKLIPQSELRNVLQSAKAEGVLREVPADFDGTMDVNGHSVPAQRVKIADRFSVSAKEMKEMGLPNEAVMPSQILHEVDPVLSGIKSPARGPGGPLNILIRGYLFAPGDVGAHTFTLSSLGRASQKTAISTGFPPLDNILSSVGTLRTLAGLKDVFNLTHSKADRIQANLLAARAGVFKGLPDVEPTTKVGQAVYGAARKMGMPEKVDLTSPGGYVLYGPRGVYSNAITGVYKMMKATGATDAEIENAFRTLPSHLESSQPTAQKLLNVVGMGTFYQTGTKALSAGLKYGLQPKRLLATATFLTVAGAAADFEHKPWYDKDRKLLPGQFATGKEGNRYVLGDLRFDRTARVAMETPFRVVQAVQQGATPAEAAERGVYSAANQLIRPAFSGPVASAGSRLAGVAPYIVPSDKIRGPAAMPDVMANKSLSDRAKSLGSTVLPISNLVLGDPGEELRSNAPKSQGYSVASKVLKGLGQPPIRTVKPGAAEAQILRIRNSRNSQERSADARANRK